MYTYIHTYIHTYIYIYIHTYMPLRALYLASDYVNTAKESLRLCEYGFGMRPKSPILNYVDAAKKVHLSDYVYGGQR